MSHRDHWALEIACPYKNCGAGRGAQCLKHSRKGEAPTIRENPHAVRVRHAREAGHEPEEHVQEREEFAEWVEEQIGDDE